MRRLILLVVTVLITALSYAESNVSIGILMPETMEGVTAPTIKMLESRLRSIATHNGVSSDMNGSFVMYPVVNIIDERLVEGGLQNITLIDVEVSIYVKQTTTMAEFGTCTTTLSGSGMKRTDALKSAFTKIKSTDKSYQAFLIDTKREIVAYYISQKDNMIAKANMLANNQEYEAALAELCIYPTGVDGSMEVFEKSMEIYKLHLNKVDSQIITEATGAYALRDFEKAVTLLSQIDIESPQYDAAMGMIYQIDADTAAKQAEELRLKLEEIKYQRDKEQAAITHEREMEKAEFAHQVNMDSRDRDLSQSRIDATRAAISDIASAWSKRQPANKTTTYNQVIK